MTEQRISYTLGFIRRAGYEPVDLNSEDYRIIFDAINRTEERIEGERHRDHNWELHYADIDRRTLRYRPYVDHILQQWHEIGRIKRIAGAQRWPHGKRFALVLSHDVDHVVANSLLAKLRHLKHLSDAPARRKALIILSMAKALAMKVLRKTPHWLDLGRWADLEARHGFRSSFFFLGQPLPAPHHEDSFYKFSDSVSFRKKSTTLKSAMVNLSEEGWDVGLHGSYRSAFSLENLLAEKENLESTLGHKIKTIRQHHLRFDIAETPFHHINSGFEADASVGSNLSTDYRAGTGLPYFYFDNENERETNLLEVPLVIQEISLFDVAHLDEDAAYRQCMEMLREAETLGSAVCLLWHNSYTPNSAQVRTYERVLSAAHEMGAWGCSVADINDWCRQGHSMEFDKAFTETGATDG